MKIKLWHFIFWGFALFSITDYLTTFLATSKHGFEYEANIVYTLTGSFLFFIIFKTVFTLLYGWLLYKGYEKLEYPLVRYIFIYTACVFVFMLCFVSLNNYSIYKLDGKEIGRALTQEEKMDHYKAQMKSGESFDPGIVQKQTKADGNGSFTFLFNLFQFLCWRSFEKRRELNESN